MNDLIWLLTVRDENDDLYIATCSNGVPDPGDLVIIDGCYHTVLTSTVIRAGASELEATKELTTVYEVTRLYNLYRHAPEAAHADS